jgi:tetratricopeptide (TPR) repeat protein
MLLEHDGQFERAEELYRSALEDARATLGPAHDEIQALDGGLVDLLREQGRLEEAEEGARLALQAFGPTGAGSEVAEGRAHARLGFVLLAQERLGQASEELEQARAILEPAVGPDDVWVRYVDQLLDELP